MSFYDVKCSEQIKTIFKSGNIPHAIILQAGPYSERENIAKLISAYCICKNKSELGPCKFCDACLKISKNAHPDVKIINMPEKASSIHIDEIRKILQDMYIIPNESDYKVYLINNADKLTIQAENALLKALEEPPKSVVFILLCESASTLISTVTSRCQIFNLNYLGKSQNNFDEKAILVSNQIKEKIITNSYLEFMGLMGSITNNRKIFNDVISLLYEYFSELCFDYYKNDSLKEINIDILLKLVDEIFKFKEIANRNVNLNLLATCFCVNINRILKNEG